MALPEPPMPETPSDDEGDWDPRAALIDNEGQSRTSGNPVSLYHSRGRSKGAGELHARYLRNRRRMILNLTIAGLLCLIATIFTVKYVTEALHVA